MRIEMAFGGLRTNGNDGTFKWDHPQSLPEDGEEIVSGSSAKARVDALEGGDPIAIAFMSTLSDHEALMNIDSTSLLRQ
jgi:hypothetical protein